MGSLILASGSPVGEACDQCEDVYKVCTGWNVGPRESAVVSLG